MYTAADVNFVINYNKSNNIFRVANKRVLWYLRNIDVDNLQRAGVTIKYAEDFAQLKKQVRASLVAQKLL